MDEPTELERGRHLTYRLSRRTSSAFQIGCTIFFALLLGCAAFALVRLGPARIGSGAKYIAIIPGAIALVLLYSGIHQHLARGTPETIVEVDVTSAPRGSAVRFFFEQPGPAHFESLRANLVGEETWYERVGTRSHAKLKNLGTFNFFDSGEFVIEKGRLPFTGEAVLQVPADVQPSGEQDGHVVEWKIELWGKVVGRADFQHVFPLMIT